MSRQWLIHLAVALGLGFAAAVFNCFSKMHGFSTDCIWEGVGFVGATAGGYFILLKQSWPGMIQLPADHPAVQAAERSVADAKADAFGGHS